MPQARVKASSEQGSRNAAYKMNFLGEPSATAMRRLASNEKTPR